MSKTDKTHFKPKITVGGAKKIAANTAELHTFVCELIDNTIPMDKPKHPVSVDVVMKKTDEDAFFIITDNSIGIPRESIETVFTYGNSANHGKLRLSKMGVGMKIAIESLGELDYMITKVKGQSAYKIGIVPYRDTSEELTYYVEEYTGNELPYESGTRIRIKNCGGMLRNWQTEQDFIKFCANIEAIYPDLLNEFVNVRIEFANGKKNWGYDCVAYKPLMSHPTKIIDKELALGANELILDRVLLDIPEFPDVRAYVSAFHKPTPDMVKKYHLKTGNEMYNPENYKNSPWGYGAATSGVALKNKGKILEHNLFAKSSRNEKHGIILEIEEGIDYAALKSGVKQTNKWKAIETATIAKLESENFYIRSRAGLPSVAENTYLNKLFDKLRNSPTYKKAYGIVSSDQVIEWPRCDVGAPDGIIVSADDPTVVLYVIEGKKDLGGAEQCRQLVGYMAHYKCKSGIFLSPVIEPSFWHQLTDFNNAFNLGYNIKQIDPIDITYVNALEFFEI